MTRYARSTIVFLALVLYSATFAYGNGATTTAPTAAPNTGPMAKEILKQMSDYLSSLESFSVHVDSVVEGITPSGERLDTDRSVDIVVERPNKVRAHLVSAARDVWMYYDGTTFSIYTPRQNYYATWTAPGDMEDFVATARTKYGLVLPGGDFLARDPYSRLIQHVKSGQYIGETLIRGTMTHHLAFRQPDIDWQIWVEQGNTPLPRRIVITDKRVDGEPQYMASYSDWDLSPAIDSGTFVFTPPAGANRIDMKTLPAFRQRQAPATQPRNGGSR